MTQFETTVVGKLSGFSSLSSLGAELARFGADLLLARSFAFAALPTLFAGQTVHPYGMIDAARLRREAGHLLGLWQAAGYWLCWLTIALSVGYLAWGVAR